MNAELLTPELAGRVSDAVDASNHLVPYLQRLHVGRGAPGTTFVDNYFSYFGRPYGDEPGLGAVVDVHLIPSQYPEGDILAKHLYPARWYTAAARDPAAGVGPEWSPLLGFDPARLAPSWVQSHPGDVARQLELRPAPRPRELEPRTVLEWWHGLAVAVVLVAVVVVVGGILAVGVHDERRRHEQR